LSAMVSKRCDVWEGVEEEAEEAGGNGKLRD
jgi:hypothetical protein